MNHNQKKTRALRRAGLSLLICALPVAYLAYHHLTNVELDVTAFGVAPEFQMVFTNDPVGMTHHDTLKHLTVVAVAKDECADGCPQFIKQLEEFRNFYRQELQARTDDRNAPKETRFVVQAGAGLEHFSDDWLKVAMSPSVPYLVPEARADGPFPAVVLIDDSSYFRGFLPSSVDNFQEKLATELSRMTSAQYLHHYVNKQTLMWEKANGRSRVKEQDNQSH